MTATALLRMSACVFGIVSAAGAFAQPVEDAPPLAQETGRFQAIRMNDNIVLVIDTATGECWSRGLSPSTPWRYEDSPIRGLRRTSERARDPRPPVLTLREDELVELTVRQRGRIDVPRSNGTLFVHIADITEGQTLVSVRDEAGAPIVRDRSLRQGDALRFEIDDRPYELNVVELRNVLTGEDFAVFRLQTARRDAPVDEGTAPAPEPDDTPGNEPLRVEPPQ